MSEPHDSLHEATNPGSAELRLACAHCRAAVVVKYDLNRETADPIAQKWSCPECGGEQILSVPGRILRVTPLNRETPG